MTVDLQEGYTLMQDNLLKMTQVQHNVLSVKIEGSQVFGSTEEKWLIQWIKGIMDDFLEKITLVLSLNE